MSTRTPARRGGRTRRPSTLYPFLLVTLAAVLMLIGYVWRAPSVYHPDDYHTYAFAALNYSDIVWLYLRDGLAQQPRPYLDYALEYPALLGGLTYLLSFAPDLASYFALTYVLLSYCALGTIVALQRLPGVQAWQFAAAPALMLYTGLNWDLAAVVLAAVALVAYTRGHDRWGTLALLGGVWFKLFPVVLVGAAVVERVRERQWRAAAEIIAIFVVGSAAINVPVALANWDNWLYFFTFNTDRGAGSGLWVLFPTLTPAEVNRVSAIALVVGGLVSVALALRARHTVVVPLSAVLLLWWMFVNKVFSPQYVLWIFLALALLRTPATLWVSMVAVDIGHYAVSMLLLFSLRFENGDLVGWQSTHLRTPLEVVREGLVLVALLYGFKRLLDSDRTAASLVVPAVETPPW